MIVANNASPMKRGMWNGFERSTATDFLKTLFGYNGDTFEAAEVCAPIETQVCDPDPAEYFTDGTLTTGVFPKTTVRTGFLTCLPKDEKELAAWLSKQWPAIVEEALNDLWVLYLEALPAPSLIVPPVATIDGSIDALLDAWRTCTNGHFGEPTLVLPLHWARTASLYMPGLLDVTNVVYGLSDYASITAKPTFAYNSFNIDPTTGFPFVTTHETTVSLGNRLSPEIKAQVGLVAQSCCSFYLTLGP